MSFEVFINCDLEGCRDKAQVPQVGNLPKNWIGMNYPTVKLNNNSQLAGETQTVLEGKVFCSWVCISKFVKGFVHERARK